MESLAGAGDRACAERADSHPGQSRDDSGDPRLRRFSDQQAFELVRRGGVTGRIPCGPEQLRRSRPRLAALAAVDQQSIPEPDHQGKRRRTAYLFPGCALVALDEEDLKHKVPQYRGSPSEPYLPANAGGRHFATKRFAVLWRLVRSGVASSEPGPTRASYTHHSSGCVRARTTPLFSS